ncbi:MAG: N-6 DNA methylase [Spirochaetota bacterium]|nr:N-6 DNA methylase [Spirochaetota bacterium]
MSYSKFHYIEQGLEEINYDFHEKRFSSQEFALCYLVHACKKQNISLDKKIFELIKVIEKKQSIKEFLNYELRDIANIELNAFSKVDEEELENYLINFQKEKIAFRPKESLFTTFTPWEVAKLSSLILEPKESDIVGDFCFGTGDFSFTLLENFDVKHLEGFERSFENEQIGELIAEVRGYNISLVATDILTNSPEKQKYSKIFFNCPFGLTLHDKSSIMKALNEDFQNKVKRLRSEYIFIQRVLDSLKQDGKAIVFVPLVVLSSKDGFIEYLISNGYINAVIQFAPNILVGTSIPFAMLVLSFKNEKVKLIDASEIFTKSRWKNLLSSNDIDEISLAYFEDESEFTKYVTYEEIKNNNFDLSIHNYFYEKKIILKDVDCEYRTLSELCSTGIRRGVQYKSEELNSKSTLLPTNNFYLSATSIQDNMIIDELPNLLEIENKNLTYCLEDGDLVLANINTTPLKVALAKDIRDKKIVVSSTIFIIRLNKNIVLPLYIKMLLETEDCQKIFSLFNSGSTSISAEFLNTLQIPVLPLEQQEKMVAKYLDYEEKIKTLKSGIKSLESEQREIIYSVSKGGNNAD